MKESTNNRSPFDQYILAEIDKVEFAFNPADWRAVSGQLNDFELNTGIRHKYTRLKALVKWLTGGIFVMTVVILAILLTPKGDQQPRQLMQPVIESFDEEDQEAPIEDESRDILSETENIMLPERYQLQVEFLPLNQIQLIAPMEAGRSSLQDPAFSLRIYPEKVIKQIDSIQRELEKKHLLW